MGTDRLGGRGVRGRENGGTSYGTREQAFWYDGCVGGIHAGEESNTAKRAQRFPEGGNKDNHRRLKELLEVSEEWEQGTVKLTFSTAQFNGIAGFISFCLSLL